MMRHWLNDTNRAELAECLNCSPSEVEARLDEQKARCVYPLRIYEAPPFLTAEAFALLVQYRASTEEAPAREVHAKLLHIEASTLPPVSRAVELVRVAIKRELNHRFAVKRDEQSVFSVTNTYPVGHPIRDSHDAALARMAETVEANRHYLDEAFARYEADERRVDAARAAA